MLPFHRVSAADSKYVSVWNL